MEGTKCFLCGRPGAINCPFCGHIAFCGDKHLNVHRPGSYCFPFTISSAEGRGRFLVATRDIAPQELILVDSPIVQTPYTKSKAQCLQCYKKVSGKYKCKGCGFPMCNVECARGDLHRIECQVFEEADFEAEIDDLESDDDHYAAIMPLRCLNLKRTDPEMWERFLSFSGHCEEQKRMYPDLYDYHQEHSVEFLRDTCELENLYTEEEIHQVIGIMYINSVNMDMAPGHGLGTAFYPTFANINHSCISNTKTVKLPNNQLEVRAVTRIKAGQEISTQYVTPDKPTRVRRSMLYKKWFFLCDCTRCGDRSECGSCLGALLCPVPRCGGTVLPNNPLQEQTDYSCTSCYHQIEHSQAERILTTAERQIRTPSNKYNLVEHMEHFLYTQSKVLHPHNYIMVTVKLKLGCMYGNCPGYSEDNLSNPLLERKLQVCQDVMDALDHVDPGYNKWRGKVEAELRKAKFMMAKRMMSKAPESYFEKFQVEKRFLKMYQSMYGSVLVN